METFLLSAIGLVTSGLQAAIFFILKGIQDDLNALNLHITTHTENSTIHCSHELKARCLARKG